MHRHGCLAYIELLSRVHLVDRTHDLAKHSLNDDL